jgi:hypothetical protein
MRRDQAIQIHGKALAAVEALTSILEVLTDTVAPAELEKLKEGVGLSIGAIEMHINVLLSQQFPDLDI